MKITTLPLLAVLALGCGGAAGTDKMLILPAEAAAPSTAATTIVGQAEATEVPPLERKIIYTATLDILVEDFPATITAVEQLADDFDAIVANSALDTAPGRPRSGNWTIRVPVERYEEFLTAAAKLGELRRQTEDSREVTAEYYDLETRIRNKQHEEERLLQHLASSTGDLEDILAVEKELSRVRTEVEQMQGQLRVLSDLTALSTVTLSIYELEGYVPAEAPSFGTRIGRSWSGSIDALVEMGQLIVISFVAAVPWLGIAAIGITLIVVAIRALLRRGTAKTA